MGSQTGKDDREMKKWICALLCLSMVAGTVSMEADASSGNGTKDEHIKIMSAGSANVDTASAETVSVETSAPQPQLPAFAGNITVDDEKVFTTVVNSVEKTCVIAGYNGNAVATTIYIPEKIGNYTVTAVNDKVFADCPYLKNVVVMGDVEFVGSSLFHSNAKPEIWGKNGGKAASYATAAGLVFHSLDGSATAAGKKAASLTKATITWSAVNGAASYNIYRKRGKENYSFYKNVTGVSFTNEKLKAGATYKYKVYPVFTASDGERIEGYASKEISVALVPAKLKSVRAKGVRGGIQVRWKRNKNVSGYQVYMKVHVKGFKTKFNKVKTIKKNKVTGYRCKMLVRGMKYSYKVRSFKKVNGKKIYSPFVTVTTRAK